MISIVIPTYNRGERLSEAVKSVLGQSSSNFELIIIDDGSSDNTVDVLQELLGSPLIYEPENSMVFKNGKIKYFFQKNSGVSAARNIGVERSNGKYILFLDSDDILLPNCVEDCLRTFDIAGSEFVVGKAVVKQWDQNVCSIHSSLNEKTDLFQWTIEGKVLLMGQFAVSKSLFLKVSGFDVSLKYAEDWAFLLSLSKSANFQFCPSVLVQRVEHSDERWYQGNVKDIVTIRLNILRKVFPNEFLHLKNKYLSQKVLFEWYFCSACFLFEHGRAGGGMWQMFQAFLASPNEWRKILWYLKNIIMNKA